MNVFSMKDAKGQKGYIITHLDEAFLIDPRGDFQLIQKKIGSAKIKAIFLTKFQTDSLPLLAAFGRIPVYISNSNGVYINKVAGIMNLSMINFIFVKEVIGINLPQMQIRTIPVLGVEEKGLLIIVVNNMFFLGSLVFDNKLIKKAYKLGAASYYHKLVRLLFSNPSNVIYPSVGEAFPVKRVLEKNLKLRAYFTAK